MGAKGGIEGIDLPVLRELKGRMRAFRNMHSVTVLNVPQLRELSVSVAFVDVKEVKMENASLFGKCEELKRVVEKKKSDDVVVRVKDVGVLPVEKRVVEKNDNCCCDFCCWGWLLSMFLFLGGLGCIFGGANNGSDAVIIIGCIIMMLGFTLMGYTTCKEEDNAC